MDATELGIQVFFLILLPGFLLAVGFRLTAGIQGRGGDFAALCTAAFWGVILLSVLGSNTVQMAKLLANPIMGGTALAMAGFVWGALFGLPVGWLRQKIR